SKLEAFPKQDIYSLLDYSEEEQENTFKDLFKSVCQANKLPESTYQNIPHIDSPSISSAVPKSSFSTDLKNGITLIPKMIFSYIPLGPFDNKYYFIKRERVQSDA
ncbi:MAG: hypothetical protein HN936_15245, partial [Bacteroidetes bacterium]|nr:hypothetical protein [Bacteroidota bacterium]